MSGSCPTPWWRCAHCVVGVMLNGMIPMIVLLMAAYALWRLLP